mmetsp:Transcript_1727/g.2405  ORF Transcript_1727/g.2405 Transcript_1727/m.2405 type:complete len:91 (+) Transcript_1727:1008-1280(+)
MSENELVNEKERVNQDLLKKNNQLDLQNKQAIRAKESMESNLKRVYEEAHEVKAILDQELRQYEQSKGKLSAMRRQNLVLWKHIKKLMKR